MIKIIIFLFLIQFTAFAKGPIILLDPGHGGDDCGAKTTIATKLKKSTKIDVVCEKDMALRLTKRIYKKLKKYYTVYMTRSVDRYVSLEDRAELAETINADIFISVHMNSSSSTRSHGLETFYLDNHDHAGVKRLEEVENRNAKGEQVMINKILADLVIQRTAPMSKGLAESIHNQISTKVSKKFKISDRGIKPAIFYVLALSKIPAILLEAGFVSNKEEIKKLRSKEFQEAYSSAVVNGIRNYMKKRKNNEKKKVSLF